MADELTADDDVAPREEIIRLKCDLDVQRGVHADRDDDLAGARQVNRDLVAKLRRSQPRLGRRDLPR